jgi:hypothetical protein
MFDPEKPMYYKMLPNGAVEPAEREEWASSFEGDKRRIGRTTVGLCLVSTVFLGLDHNWGIGPPILFETMTFARREFMGDEYGGDMSCERYATLVEAQDGHDRAVAKARTLNMQFYAVGEIVRAWWTRITQGPRHKRLENMMAKMREWREAQDKPEKETP